MELADEAGLDLVEISPNASPPVCKIMDFGKFKYEQQKRESEARKKQKIIEIKDTKNLQICQFQTSAISCPNP